jgi:hypothetical protein
MMGKKGDSMKPSPNYQYMAEEISKRYIANRWWSDCTPDKIYELVDDEEELKEWFVSALYADRLPKKAREGQVIELEREGYIDRCMFLKGKWTLVDTRPDYLR